VRKTTPAASTAAFTFITVSNLAWKVSSDASSRLTVMAVGSQMVRITGVAAQLFVNDVIESAEYYRDVLGFSFDQFFREPPVFVGVDRGAARLLLKNAPEDRKPLVSNNASPGGFTDVSTSSSAAMATMTSWGSAT
jgi:hypothetical protein